MYLHTKTSAKIFTQENCVHCRLNHKLHVSELRILIKSIFLKIGYDQYISCGNRKVLDSFEFETLGDFGGVLTESFSLCFCSYLNGSRLYHIRIFLMLFIYIRTIRSLIVFYYFFTLVFTCTFLD
jgi:hypothetical protein